ncbi:MAG: hypothetical protein AAFN13_04340 [Bacteroidota bacterium]
MLVTMMLPEVPERLDGAQRELDERRDGPFSGEFLEKAVEGDVAADVGTDFALEDLEADGLHSLARLDKSDLRVFVGEAKGLADEASEPGDLLLETVKAIVRRW